MARSIATSGHTNGNGVLSLDDLRAILSDEILKIREGNATAASVNAISNATGKILSSVKLQMEYYKMTGKSIDIPLLMGPGK